MAGPGDQKPEERRSYFDSINPWSAGRSSTMIYKDNNSQPQPHAPVPSSQPPSTAPLTPPVAAVVATSSQSTANPTPANHSTSHLYGHSVSKYPSDCPPLKVHWFHAVDVPKRKPRLSLPTTKSKAQDKPQPQPKKYIAFSGSDSQAIEIAYQKLLEVWENDRDTTDDSMGKVMSKKRGFSLVASPTTAKGGEPEISKPPGTFVPVNEDYLFEVNIEERELNPIYWLGPTYDVRRGTWFYQEGNTLRPCEENLACQLEEGYLKTKPWTYPEIISKGARSRSASGRNITPKSSVESLKAAATDTQAKPLRPISHQPQTYRLFGTYMNHVATYQDSSIAWLSSDGMFSWVTSYLGGTKLVRGYADPTKAQEEIKTSTTPATSSLGLQLDEKQQKLLKPQSALPTSKPAAGADQDHDANRNKNTEEGSSVQSRLTRQISGLMGRGDPVREEEEARKWEEEEIENDYNAQAGETQGREIEHLILVTHGIGQLLSLRMESINFIHDINSFRKTFKSIYANSADLRALNSELGGGPGNCRIQVLPVCWRHLLDFPRKRENKAERDVSDGLGDEDDYPSLDDITVEGVAFARSLISDLALDVLLYQSAYRSQISEIVLKESNRIYNLFMERNPKFKGKVHIMGHSLGSAIMFDILCRQKEHRKPEAPAQPPLRLWPSSPDASKTKPKDPRDLRFDFEVADFYCLGSPIGLFQMLKGRTIAARNMPNSIPSESPFGPDMVDDPFLSIPGGAPGLGSHYPDISSQRLVSPVTGLPFSVSSPKVSQLFNIFHPSDPISYRIEPLISPMMRDLKPQAMPYTKKSIFGAMAPQGLTGIGARVGQSVNSLWSSVSSGITTSFVNRSLGLSNEDVANMNAASKFQASNSTAAAGDPLTPGFVEKSLSDAVVKTDARKKELASSAMKLNRRTSTSGNDLTLLDDELETLYSKFEKTKHVRGTGAIAEEDGDNGSTANKSGDEESKVNKLRREEMKVRAINRNGRVDFCIQEGTLDYNPLNALASHMSYWTDEDVGHFVMSQLLSNRSGKDM